MRDSVTVGWLFGLAILVNVILGIVALEILEVFGLWPPAENPSSP